jgi:hypothetical protein
LGEENLLSDFNDRSSPTNLQEDDGEEEDEQIVRPEQLAAADPYAGLDLAFGSYMAPQPPRVQRQLSLAEDYGKQVSTPPSPPLSPMHLPPTQTYQAPAQQNGKKSIRNSFRQSMRVFSELPVNTNM